MKLNVMTQVLTIEQLTKLSTPRLLNYKKKNYPRPNPFMYNYYHNGCQCVDCQKVDQKNVEYMVTFNAIKEILTVREHVG